MDDLYGLIQNFGELRLLVQNTNYNATTNYNTNPVFPTNHSNQNNIPPEVNHRNEHQNLNTTIQPQTDFRRRRQTWNRSNRDVEFVNSNNHDDDEPMNNTVPLPNSHRNVSSQSSQITPRSIFGPNPFSNGNNTNRTDRQNTNQRNHSQPPPPPPPMVRPGSRPIFGGAGAASTARSAENGNVRHRSQAASPPGRRPMLVRSDTFELDHPTTNSTPQIRAGQNSNANNNDELYNVRRRPRARSPVTFAVMLDEPESNIQFDVPTNGSILTETLLNNPTIDYVSKTRANHIIGKQGRDPSEFVWPIGIAINPIGKHIIVADSNNHRVQIFESNGNFVKSVGSQGTRDGQFDCISDVTVDAMANLYVVDRHNHRIQIFDRYCRFLRVLGSGPGQYR